MKEYQAEKELPKADGKAKLDEVIERLVRDEPAFRTSKDFGPYVRQGDGAGPSLLIGDQSTIELYSRADASTLDHRMTLLAGPSDIAIVRRRSRSFETYLHDALGLEGLTFLEMNGDDPRPVCAQCRTEPKVFERLTEKLLKSSGLTVKSYLTTGHDWRLAQALGDATRCTVHVHGPAPRIGHRANDKLWFWRQARRILGTRTVPPTFHAFGPAAAAAQVARVAASGGDAIVKVPSSAGGTGNLRLPANIVGGLTLAQVRALIVGRLHAAGWQDTYPILVGVWEKNASQSPSAQVFIPLPHDGPPRIDGLFEQRISGPQGQFVGAVPAILPDQIHNRMIQEAKRLAMVFQALGYFGYCSFDALLLEDGTLHWIECNGRWSGVSIPLAAARIHVGHISGGIAIAQDHMGRPGINTEALIDTLDDLLYRKGNSRGGLLLLSPPSEAGPLLFNAVAVAATQSAAEDLLEEGRRRLG